MRRKELETGRVPYPNHPTMNRQRDDADRQRCRTQPAAAAPNRQKRSPKKNAAGADLVWFWEYTTTRFGAPPRRYESASWGARTRPELCVVAVRARGQERVQVAW